MGPVGGRGYRSCHDVSGGSSRGGSSHGNNINACWAPSICHLFSSQHPGGRCPTILIFGIKRLRNREVIGVTGVTAPVSGELGPSLGSGCHCHPGGQGGVKQTRPVLKIRKPRKLVLFLKQNDGKCFRFMHEKRHNFVTR